jgi:hypothetical protein
VFQAKVEICRKAKLRKKVVKNSTRNHSHATLKR